MRIQDYKFSPHLLEGAGKFATPTELRFRHGHWQARREKVFEQLVRCATNERKLFAFAQCGGDCVTEWSDKLQKRRLRANYCKCRHCEPCMAAKGGKIARNLKERLGQGNAKSYRFLTLTKRANHRPLASQINTIYEDFRRLRATRFWINSVDGGAACLEVKFNFVPQMNLGSSARIKAAEEVNPLGHWHVHLHCVIEGNWLDARDLSAAWLKATGDSYIVDIRPLKDPKEAAHYVAKYVSKGTSPEVWSHADLAQEWILSTGGVRTALTFGSWRGFRLTAVSKTTDDWQREDRLENWIDRALAGEVHAQTVLALLRPPGWNSAEQLHDLHPRPPTTHKLRPNFEANLPFAS